MKKTLKNTVYSCIFICYFFSSCKKDVPPQSESVILNGSSGKVFIANEGNFNFANSSISLHDPETGATISDIYKPNNNNTALGDICQSLAIVENELYAVVNNSQKIVVLDMNNFQKKVSINGFTSPRYTLKVSNNKIYVSNLKLTHTTNQIQILNPHSKTITGAIPCRGWTEHMALSFGNVFVTSPTSKYVYVINSANDQITDSILVGYGSNCIVKDKDEKLWVSFSGDSTLAELPGLAKINPITRQLESSFYFTSYQGIKDLKINQSGTALYYLRNHVYKFDVMNPSLNTNPFITSSGNNFYSIGVEPITENIYVSDALNYIQNGMIFVYNQQGGLSKQFNAGIIPGYFIFSP